MKRVEIAPSVFVSTLPEEKFKRCLLSIHFVLPGKKEEATALALLPHLLERRCEAIPDPVLLSRKLSALYGAEISNESYAAGSARVVGFGISGLKNEYALEGEDLAAEYLNLLCQLLFAPKMVNGVFEAEDIAIEKEKQADFLRGEMNDKRTYCLRQARRKLFGNSRLGIETSGYLEDIEKLTPQEVTDAYHLLLQNAVVEVMVCGADEAPLCEILKTYFAKTPRTPQPLEVRGAAMPGKEMQHFEEAMDTAQGKVAILCTSGRVADAREAAVLRVAGAVLGGLPSSRLFLNVREKQGLCYYCAAGFDTLKNVMTIDSGVDHANAKKAVTAILHELQVLQTELVREEELAFAHLALKNSFVAAKDSPDALVNWAFGEQLRGSQQTLEQAAALVASVTREEVRDALAQLKPVVEYTIKGKDGGVHNAG